MSQGSPTSCGNLVKKDEPTTKEWLQHPSKPFALNSSCDRKLPLSDEFSLHRHENHLSLSRSFNTPSDTLLQEQKLQKNSSFKSLPPVPRTSFETICGSSRWNDEVSRKRLLRFLMKSNIFARRPRRRLCQRRIEAEDKSCQESSVDNLRQLLNQERDSLSAFDFMKLSRKIKNHLRRNHLLDIFDHSLHRGLACVSQFDRDHFQELARKSPGSSSRDNVAAVLDSDPMEVSDSVDVFEWFEKLHLSNSSLEQTSVNTETSKSKSGVSKDRAWWNTKVLMAPRGSSGTDELLSDEEMNNDSRRAVLEDFTSKEEKKDSSEDFMEGYRFSGKTKKGFDLRRRSIQWNNEVDVIYYAGDAHGGRVLRRNREPLREEADQQARHARFLQLALNKNLFETRRRTKGFRDSCWLDYRK